MRQREITRLIELIARRTPAKYRLVLAVVVIAAVVGYSLLKPSLARRGINLPDFETDARPDVAVVSDQPGEQAILDAFRNGKSDLIVEGSATVKKLLPDDNVGSKHQKMILKLSSGHTILLAHNIDLAPRVPAKRGDKIDFKGEYEYSEEGGVLHWTHHDPRGRHPDGWLQHEGETYQ